MVIRNEKRQGVLLASLPQYWWTEQKGQTAFFSQLPNIFHIKTTRHKEHRVFVNQDNTHPNLQTSLAVLKIGELEDILSKG